MSINNLTVALEIVNVQGEKVNLIVSETITKNRSNITDEDIIYHADPNDLDSDIIVIKNLEIIPQEHSTIFQIVKETDDEELHDLMKNSLSTSKFTETIYVVPEFTLKLKILHNETILKEISLPTVREMMEQSKKSYSCTYEYFDIEKNNYGVNGIAFVGKPEKTHNIYIIDRILIDPTLINNFKILVEPYMYD